MTDKTKCRAIATLQKNRWKSIATCIMHQKELLTRSLTEVLLKKLQKYNRICGE